MGCSHSRDRKSLSNKLKGQAWNKVVNRLLSVHDGDSSIQTKDGGYTAAAFSANRGRITNPAPAKILEKRASMQKLSGKGVDAQLKENCGEGRQNKHVPAEPSLGDTVVGIPVLHTNHVPKSIAALKSTGSSHECLETINIFELMEGLAEEEVSASFHLRHAISEPSIPLTQVSIPLTQVSDSRKFPPADNFMDNTHIQGALSGEMSTRRHRPKSSSSKSLEDVDRFLSAMRSEMVSPDSNACFPILFSEANSSTAETTGFHVDGKPSRDPGNLSRALSFKYMFDDGCDIEQEFLFSTIPSASSIHARVGRQNDLLVTPARRLWCDGGDAFGANTDFSPASLKDWLPPRNPPVSLKEGLEPSLPDSFQIPQPYASEKGACLECFDITEAGRCLTCAQEVSKNESLSMCRHQQGAVDDLSSVVEEFGSPVFDPEMLESFEAAMKHLSKEEWDAVRGMEDSPQNFLRLMKVLKKSSSNNHMALGDSMRAHTKAGCFPTMQDATHVVGLDGNKEQCGGAAKLPVAKLKSLSLEKRLAYIRQNSLEVRRALANGLLKDDSERGALVVFYSSTSQANAKTYEDCNHVRSILRSLMGVSYVERSISEFPEHEHELRRVLNVSTAVVPTIYVQGKCLVGVDSILQLYKKGLLGAMLQVAASFVSNTVSMQCRRKSSGGVSEGTASCTYCSGAGGRIEHPKCSCP